jgi:hypothetical protein
MHGFFKDSDGAAGYRIPIDPGSFWTRMAAVRYVAESARARRFFGRRISA